METVGWPSVGSVGRWLGQLAIRWAGGLWVGVGWAQHIPNTQPVRDWGCQHPPPYFEGVVSVSGLGLAQTPGFWVVLG